jgi:protocatechuate 3,4-dioxygenase beta subunit
MSLRFEAPGGKRIALARCNGRDDRRRMEPHDFASGRRRILQLLLAAPIGLVLGSRLFTPAEAAAAEARAAAIEAGKRVAPTPECDDGDDPTPAETAGPFFKPRSPERASLIESKMAGARIEITGRVFGPDCKPIAGALLDFWQADDAGEYDNEGYRLRGHQFADAEGRYRLTTIVPGLYTGRTRHIHVRVQPKGGRALTTQLYFPGEKANRGDFLFRSELLVAPEKGSAPRRARFHFVLAGERDA